RKKTGSLITRRRAKPSPSPIGRGNKINIMPVRTRKDLEQALKQGQIEPVYFLYGSEVYLRDQAMRLITETALTGTLLREFNDSSFNLLTNDVRDAIAVAEQ